MKPAVSRPKARAALMEELEHAVRRSSALGVIFGQTVASRIGISSSAGRLAELTGLTTGAITGVVDRLEQAGLVRRERDASDRRKVFIATVPENIAKVGKFYEHMQRAMLKDWDSYSDAELKLLLRFMTQGYKTMLAATEELKVMMEAPKSKRAGAKRPARAP